MGQKTAGTAHEPKQPVAMSVRFLSGCLILALWCTPQPAAATASGVFTPSDISLPQLLERHRAAVGTPAAWTTRREEWSFTDGGLDGTRTSVSNGTDERTTMVQGPFHSAYGRYHGQLWEQNENGITRNVRGLHRRNRRSAEALASLDGITSDATLLGRTMDPCACYVVDLNPPNGRHERLFYDASWLIIRCEYRYPRVTEIETLDDYRLLRGAKRAFHLHFSNGLAGDDRDWRLVRAVYNTPVTDDEVAVLGSNVAITMPNRASVPLPVEIRDRRIIVHAEVNGQPLDFLLDSGASGIFIGRDAMAQLQLPTYGAETTTQTGDLTELRTMVHEMRVGDITMTNVAATVIPPQSDLDEKDKLAGLIGFDFLAELIVRIDYNAGTVTAFNPALFSVPPAARRMDAILDDGVPIVDVGVGASTGHFIVDTGADFPMLFSTFAAAHPDDAKDIGLRTELADPGSLITKTTENMGLNAVISVAGERRITSVTLRSLHFCGISFDGALAWISPKGSRFDEEDVDGLIGSEILHYFIVYLDYGNERILLEKAHQ